MKRTPLQKAIQHGAVYSGPLPIVRAISETGLREMHDEMDMQLLQLYTRQLEALNAGELVSQVPDDEDDWVRRQLEDRIADIVAGRLTRV